MGKNEDDASQVATEAQPATEVAQLPQSPTTETVAAKPLSKVAKQGEVVGDESDELDEVGETTEIILALSEQVRAIAESPGAQALLSGLGAKANAEAEISLTTAKSSAELAALQAKNQHELSMAQEATRAATLARRDKFGGAWLLLVSVLGPACLGGMLALINMNVLTKENALTLVVILGALGSWVKGQFNKTPAA